MTTKLFNKTLPVSHKALHWLLATVRGRFAVISLVLLLLLLAFSLYTWRLVTYSSDETNRVLDSYYALEYQSLQRLFADISDVEASLYQYAILLDEPLKQRVDKRLQRIIGTVSEFRRKTKGQGEDALYATVITLDEQLQHTRELVDQLLLLLSTAEHRYPAIDTIFNRMYPNHQRIMAELGMAMREVEQQPEQQSRDLHMYWQRLEHAWMQLTLASRMMIANRSGVFGDPGATMRINHANHQLWRKKVDEILAMLQQEDEKGRLGLQQSAALEQIVIAAADYQSGYQQVYAILNSDQWRTDLPYLRHEVRPAFDAIRETSLQLREQITARMKTALFQAQQTSDRLVLFIWSLAFIAVLLFVLAYFSFVRFIYRPLKDVATAMESAGRGEHYSLLHNSNIDEINMLVHAYDGMQAQVHSRQVRLQSILENISDGIITIDERGMIETFNTAAQKLFGYSFEEAYGQPVTLLMPESMRASHPVYIDNYKRNGIRHAIDREREEMARRKDGTIFPMSIKVKEMDLDGKRLFTAVVADISERKAAMERLREMAEKDALTGLHNRRYFLDELERAVKRARRGGTPVTLLYIDLDNFKFVNDTMGHQAGDQVLIEVTEMLSERVRSGDLFARLGGDEFAVLLYELDDATAMSVADSYRQVLAEYRFKFDGRVVDIGCSIGVAPYGEGVGNKEDLLARADLACNIAKSSGRNRTHLFDASSQEEVEGMSADMGWARRIKEAIESDGFTLAYQPIVRSVDSGVHSYEVLIRMNGSDGELISPAGFLPAAERFGLMVELDRWVIRHAIRALRAMQQKRPELALNINLSAPSMETPDILDTVREQLQEHAVDARCLVFEITETTAITKLSQAVEVLDGLKALGCGTALDDFGTGYSSFAYLKELPVDYVKIDGSFVQNLDRDRLNQVMVRSMHDVAHAMGKRSVAEFVETEAVRQLLNEIGVDYQQGYYLGKPELNIVP